MGISRYPRISPEERRMLERNRVMREGARAGAVTLGVSFGSTPTSEPAAPLGGATDYYELSEDDRALIEKVIADNQHPDALRRKEALKWWSDAVYKAVPNLAAIDPVLGLGGLAGSFILDFYGRKVLQPFELSEEAVFYSNGETTCVITEVSIGADPADAFDGIVPVSVSGAFSILNWDCSGPTTINNPSYGACVGSQYILYSNNGLSFTVDNMGAGSGGVLTGRSSSGGQLSIEGDDPSDCAFPGYDVPDYRDSCLGAPVPKMWVTHATRSGTLKISQSTKQLKSCIFEAGEDQVCVTVTYGDPYDGLPALGTPTPADPSVPADLPVDPCDLIPPLKDYPYPPDPTTPVTPGVPVTPTVPTDPTVPGGGAGPGGGMPSGSGPGDPVGPGDPAVPGANPPQQCAIDTAEISEAAAECLTSGQSGAWRGRPTDSAERLYAPEGTSGCREFDAIDEAYCVDALVAEGWTASTPESGGLTKVCPPSDWCAGGGPVDPSVPVTPGIPTFPTTPEMPPIEDGVLDPGDGSCVTMSSEPADFTDPNQPGGINRKYQPGQRMSVKTSGSRVTLSPPAGADGGIDYLAVQTLGFSQECWDSLIASGWRVQGLGDLAVIYPRDGLPVRRETLTTFARDCLIEFGWSEEEEDATEQEGTIQKTQRGQNGKGPTVCIDPAIPTPPIPGDPLKEKTCYGPGPVTDAISSILQSMGVRTSVIFDSECVKELPNQVCFKAGTPKRRVLNTFLKMCGFCVFPQLDGNVLVGYCTPKDVHWHFHEDVDLIGFDLEYDDTEAYAYVRVWMPPRTDRAGRIIDDGYEIMYPVATPIAVNPDKILDVPVPHGFPYDQAMAVAMNRAREVAAQALPLIAFAVPINTQIKERHQLHIKRPSQGFNAVYMATKVALDFSSEGYLTTGLARWLRPESATTPAGRVPF